MSTPLDTSTGTSTLSATEDDDQHTIIEVDQIQVNIPECFVYKIPVLRTSQGHRAEDWKLEHPLFTGGLRVYQRNDILRIIIYSKMPISLQPIDDSPYSIFAECPIKINPSEEGDMTRFCDGVIDSSRYFVLRVEDNATKRHTYIGVGFRERDTAFEFKNALNDYIKYMTRSSCAKQLQIQQQESETSTDSESPTGTRPVSLKFALKEGEKIHVKIGHNTADSKEKERPVAEQSGGVIKIKPLMKPLSRETSTQLPSPPAHATLDTAVDDDWGDFVTSSTT